MKLAEFTSELEALLDKYGMEPWPDDGLWIIRAPIGWMMAGGQDYFTTRFREKIGGEFAQCDCPSHKDQNGKVTYRGQQ